MELKDQVMELVGNDGKADKILEIIRKENDRAVTQGIKTFQEKTLPSLIEKEITTRTQQDPIKEKERELDIKIKATELSAETGIPYSVILRQLSGDEEKDEVAISELAQLIENIRTDKANEMLANSAYKPTDNNGFTPSYTAKDLDRIPFKERVKLYKEGAFNTLLGRS